jgi:hypothetical protein
VKWYRDRQLWVALTLGTLLRVVPALYWWDDGCVRDECTYIKLAERFADGEGMTSSVGWIWAPGYPVLLGISRMLTGYASTFKGVQVFASIVNGVLVYLLAARAFAGREGPKLLRPRRIALWLYMLSPHMAFFSTRLWSETLYTTVLLGALLLLLKARDALEASPEGHKPLLMAAGVGGLVGICVLFRGVATYMLPILVVGMLWAHWRQGRAWLQGALLAIGAVIVVAPYSLHASEKFGGRIISDSTLGQMMWLGNNDFEPITFDYGNGKLSKRAFNRTRKQGRPACGDRDDAIGRETCQKEAGIEWIKDHPEEFARRMPMRVAQLMNPHSLLTRHLRWGRWPGMHQLSDELIILAGCLHSLFTILVGAFGLSARGRGAQPVVFGGILVYHCAAISVLAGLSRYRVPLEPLLMIYAAGVVASPRLALAELSSSKGHWRVWLTLAVMGAVTPLALWYLPAGWPWWRTW